MGRRGDASGGGGGGQSSPAKAPPVDQYRKQLGKHSNQRAKKTILKEFRRKREVKSGVLRGYITTATTILGLLTLLLAGVYLLMVWALRTNNEQLQQMVADANAVVAPLLDHYGQIVDGVYREYIRPYLPF